MKERVSVIGTGAIGSPIARCLIRAGFSTTVYDIKKTAIEPLVGMGAKRAECIADCADNDVIIVIVANDNQVEDVVAGSEGIINHISEQANPVLVIMSTVSPKTVYRLGELCDKKNVDIIDAPISGGHVAAEKGNLSIMVGGNKEVFERIKHLLSVIGERLYYIGKLGAGETMKLVNNLIGVTNMFLTIEALSIGVRSGIPLDTLISVINTSSGSNFFTRNWSTSKAFFSDFAKNNDSAQNNLSLSIKDLSHAQELATLVYDQSPILKKLIEGLNEMMPEYLVNEWSAVPK
jgi:3-hydroxyisobutyrate dehydrogenase